MLLNQANAATIAAHFGNKFRVVEYCGCWTNDTITFGLYQTSEREAGVEVTLRRPKGDIMEKVEVLRAKRLRAFRWDHQRRIYTEFYLPIIKA